VSSREREISRTLATWFLEGPNQDPDWGPEDWQALKSVVRVHGAGPLLHLALRPVTWLPDEMRLWFAEQYRFSRERAARLQDDLQGLLAAFGSGAIAVMPLKGSLLSAAYYPDPALRPMADLDLLVRPAARTAAEALLEKLGYRRISANWKHTEWGRPGNLEVASWEFEHPDNPRKLDLHVSVSEMLGGPAIDLTGLLWQRAAPGRLLGEPVLLPHPEDLWLHLLMHVNSEVWGLTSRLVHLYDLSLLPRPDALPDEDPRFFYLALRLLQATFPDPGLVEMLAHCEQALSPVFQAWAGRFDLFSSSYLGRETAEPYLERLRLFYGGRTADLLAALKFMLLPVREEVRFEAGEVAGGFRLVAAWGRILGRKIGMISRLAS